MLDRRRFLEQSAFCASLISTPLLVSLAGTQEAQSKPAAPSPIPEPHFPSRLHEFVWRNWELTNTERLARVLLTTPANVLSLGLSMGLPAKIELTPDQLRRIYVTTIRQNWHLLPNEQIIELLGWTPAQYEYHLKEDDFLWVKLGSLKPRCEKLVYRPCTAEEAARAAKIRALVNNVFGSDLQKAGEAPFRFVHDLSTPAGSMPGPNLPVSENRRTARFNPRYVYSYFALYGDPLLEEGIDPFPDGLLEKLSEAGVNGVWMQAVLRNLAPSSTFPEFGENWEKRLQNLAKLVDRAARYGVKVYFYINEPRSMPAEFFQRHPGAKGTRDPSDNGYFALCTSTPEVRQWLADGLAHVFAHAPGLGGIFCITASENLTNCVSHGHAEFCSRCSQRDGSDVIAEVIEAMRSGVRRISTSADVIAWDWGWGNDWVRNGAETEKVIPKLSNDVAILSMSEFGKAIDRASVQTKVGEYSISVIGPGPRAAKTWQLAQESNKAAFAKVQWNNSWEISAVPYIPVPQLIAEHCQNLVNAKVQGLMLSWTLGGYPSPNFEVAKELYFASSPDTQDILRQVATRRYGAAAADHALGAWETFSRAFSEYPMDGGSLVYRIPTQHGPANLLRLHPTGYKAGMILFPYDDYTSWVGPYPAEAVEHQFDKMAREWKPGLDRFREVLAKAPPDREQMVQKELGIAETCYLHFQSVANQIRFYRLRDQWLSTQDEASRSRLAEGMTNIAEQELELAKRQYIVAKRDSTIAYEATNHYYYRPLGLVEKVLNCQYVIDQLSKAPAHARR